jgi:hypothetical protein
MVRVRCQSRLARKVKPRGSPRARRLSSLGAGSKSRDLAFRSPPSNKKTSAAFLFCMDWHMPPSESGRPNRTLLARCVALGARNGRLHCRWPWSVRCSWPAVLVVALRQWNVQWGTTAADRASHLPGDEVVPVAHYRIDHGITINAPATSVWPWLIQIGQDRGGFYSYTRLENAVGAQITNADRIVPAWQMRRAGELVPRVPSDYLGGRFGKIGCKVLEVIPGRAMVLEGWGAFVLVPTSETGTRMLVRTRLEGEPDFGTVITRPFRLLVYEPAHLIMERRMLLGIKERAERTYGATESARE